MKPTRKKKVPPARQLGILAMQFRGTRDQAQRASIAREYSRTVAQLIDGKKWRRIPRLEDQLPDSWMPEAFFSYWSLGPPMQQKRRRG
jgi:hypothetical protein